MFKLVGGSATFIAVLILIILVVILLVYTVALTLRVRRLTRKYQMFMKGADGISIEKLLAGKLQALDKVQERQAVTKEELKRVDRVFDRDLVNYGIVKYDAFEDVGGKMSFALALLDKNNTGFVINTIHSRDDCYVYLKEIVKGESFIMLSDEETEALRKAAHMGEADFIPDDVPEDVKKVLKEK